jgi:hypothetical protein
MGGFLFFTRCVDNFYHCYCYCSWFWTCLPPGAIVVQVYGPLDAFGGPNILTSGDTAYWKAVRQATAPCFSMSNIKQVGKLEGVARQRWIAQKHSC